MNLPAPAFMTNCQRSDEFLIRLQILLGQAWIKAEESWGNKWLQKDQIFKILIDINIL